MTLESVNPVRLLLVVIGGGLILRVARTYTATRRQAETHQDTLQRHRLFVLLCSSASFVTLLTALVLGMLDTAIALGFVLAIIGIALGLVGVISLVWLFHRETRGR